MKMNAPKNATWTIAVILGLVGLVGHLVPIAQVAPYSFWLVSAGFVLLALASLLKGL